jgi:hypothetical protein
MDICLQNEFGIVAARNEANTLENMEIAIDGGILNRLNLDSFQGDMTLEAFRRLNINSALYEDDDIGFDEDEFDEEEWDEDEFEEEFDENWEDEFDGEWDEDEEWDDDEEDLDEDEDDFDDED